FRCRKTISLEANHGQLRWCLPTEALALDLAPADIPLLHAFIAQRPTLSVR
ncbi:hypothetical protein ACLBQC_30510, partial [Klebsiella pneumoniae]